MEEEKDVASKTNEIPNTAAQNLPPQTQQVPVSSSTENNKKRKVDDIDIKNSKYFKIRALVRDIRPHFIEVLRTPDFRDSKAAHEIRHNMKLLMDLYKEMTMETITIGKCKKLSEGQSVPGDSKDEQKPLEKRQEQKQVELPPHHRAPEKLPEEKFSGSGNNAEMKKAEEGQIEGTCVVGGSAFGWNFIMYPGNKPVYCGVTKESRQTKK